MIAHFYIRPPRGDTIITRDYLGNVPKVSAQVMRVLSCRHRPRGVLVRCLLGPGD